MAKTVSWLTGILSCLDNLTHLKFASVVLLSERNLFERDGKYLETLNSELIRDQFGNSRLNEENGKT